MDRLRSARLSLQALFARPFRGIETDPVNFAKHLRRPKAETSYCILFTPRSGSSRLTDILGHSKGLSRPGEVFNPDIMPGVARAYSAGSLADYLEMLPRRRNDGGVYGFQVTYPQMRLVFGSERRFRQAYPDTRFFWLLREDIVAQAVSMVKLIQTRVGHSVSASEDAIRRSESEFAYNRNEIRHQIRLLLWQETRNEAFFARFGITPVRLSYERLVRLSEAEIAAFFAGKLGVTLTGPDPDPSGHGKLAGGRSAEFIDRFRAENARWLAPLAETRQQRLEAARRTELRPD